MRPPVPSPDSVRSVVVLTKWRFMGDTVVAVPLLAGVRRVFPRAHVTLLTGPAAATMLQNCPHVDRVLAYNPYASDRGPRAVLRQWRTLRRDVRPDVCLVANRSFRSAVMGFLSGAPVRAGFAWDNRSWLLTHAVPYDGEKPEAECDLDVLRAVAPEPPGRPYDTMPRLWVTDGERARGAELLRERGVGLSGVPLVGIQPGASHAVKQWSVEHFARVADALTGGGAGVVLVGGREEVPDAEAMKAAMRGPVAADLTGATKLRETMGVLPHLSLFVGNDTGVNHIAAALGVPTVTLFGPTPARKWGNFGSRSAVLDAPGGDLANITTDEVVVAARGLLDAGARPVERLAR